LTSVRAWVLAGVFTAGALGVARFDGATAAGGQAPSQTTGAQRREVRIPIGNFSLTDQSGRPFEFARMKGKVIVVDFAYTTCPDVCPLLTAAMRQLQESLSRDEHDAVHLLTVTTDPEIDDPKVLTSYAKRYGADLSNWSFVTGAEPSLRGVWKNFGVRVRRIARGLVDHTALTAVVDKTGTMRVAYHGAAPDPRSIAQNVRSLLAE
jgi:protein SCO1/2